MPPNAAAPRVRAAEGEACRASPPTCGIGGSLTRSTVRISLEAPVGVGVVRAIRVDSHSRGLRSNVGIESHSGSGWQPIRQHVRLAHSDERNGRRSAAACGVAFSGASHRPHSSGACPPRGQSSGPLSPESPRPLCATQVPGPVVLLQPRRLPTPSRSGDLWTFLGAPPRSSTLYDLGALGFPVGCRGHEHTHGCAELCGHPNQGASTQASKLC